MELLRKIKFKSEWEFLLYFGLYGMYAMILFLTNQELTPFAGYPFDHALDPYVLLSPAGGA
jgi:hypothetical protein